MSFDPPTIIARVLTLVIAFTLHEYAHAWTATRFGDYSAQDAGRLTLNPLSHLDPIGTLMLIIAGFGWAKPVPINPQAIRRNNPAGVLWVSLAGPLTNLLLALAAAIPLRFSLVNISQPSGTIFPSIGYFLLTFVMINITLFIFNLLPLAPLDGEKVFSFFLPRSWQSALDGIRRYSPMILLLLVVAGPSLGFDLIGRLVYEPVMAITRFLINR
jgi:Zn-dependent protease